MNTCLSFKLFVCNFLWTCETEDCTCEWAFGEVLVTFINLFGLLASIYLDYLLLEVKKYVFVFWGICFVSFLFCLIWIIPAIILDI